MTARVIGFPAFSVLAAGRELQAPTSLEAEELAASVLVVAIQKGYPVPPQTLLLLLCTLRRHAKDRLGLPLAHALAEFDDHLEVLIIGQHLLPEPAN